MITRGRPRVSEVQLKNGFYIEVFDKGVKKGMKIRSDNKHAMEANATLYGQYKDVSILGEYKDGVPLIEASAS
ncbi:MAG: hypothetical protein WDN26_05400 [Chitinophagaceae bacterium]